MTLVSVTEARKWAVDFTGRKVTTSNITYLVNYARINNYGNNGEIKISLEELKEYYRTLTQEKEWKEQLGEDLNWTLSFDQYKESERTKHVHRLHPYKGKFIPQLVEYFIDSHTDKFKKETYFKPGDIILDPFCGSGTTLIEANEKGMDAIGIDISEFNALISNTKLSKIDYWDLSICIDDLNYKLEKFVKASGILEFDNEILDALSDFNKEYFPSPAFKWKVIKKQINEYSYAEEKFKEFKIKYGEITDKYHINIMPDHPINFIDTWFLPPIKKEIEFMISLINEISSKELKNVITVILSRTIRSCRATSHSDLATLQKPVYEPYYCSKHKKVCKPLLTIFSWWKRYANDAIQRYLQFGHLRTDTNQHCLTGDARSINIIESLQREKPGMAEKVKNQKIKGIFSSPPYVGLINYHEQHQYAYEFFGYINRQDDEIGPLFRGKGKQAQLSYIQGIAKVLNNCKQYLTDDYDIFLVANDNYGLYDKISEQTGMEIVNQYKRPVLNRTEKDKNAYSEIIFHLKEKVQC
ncbi:MAG: site-specific DNA-methyltransferase [Candidatus Cloacimonetes bacterium]|nr:site-specific DNA-methyltransferase [Candidatus Cloacimonadota bacterium]